MDTLIFVLIIVGFLSLVSSTLLLRHGTTPAHWAAALGQLFIIWVIGNLPFGILIFSMALDPGRLNLAGFIGKNLINSELLIYISAILSPVFYTLFFNLKEKLKFYLFLHFISILICIVGASLLYERSNKGVPTDNDMVVTVGWVMYVLAMAIWYFSLVYERATTDTSPGGASSARAIRIRDSLS